MRSRGPVCFTTTLLRFIGIEDSSVVVVVVVHTGHLVRSRQASFQFIWKNVSYSILVLSLASNTF